MKILKDYLVIKKDDFNYTSSLIILDNVKKEEKFLLPPYSGTIVDVGIEVNDDRFKVGVKILFQDFGCIPFDGYKEYTKDNCYYVLVPVSSVTGIVNDKNLKLS